MYIQLNHFTAQQKLTHCKATVIQVLKKALSEDKIMVDMKQRQGEKMSSIL